MLAQDRVLVIYSVDCLPEKHGSVDEVGSYSQMQGVSAWKCCCTTPITAKGAHGVRAACLSCSGPSMAVNGSLPSSSHCMSSINAWGRISLGLRIATFSASELIERAEVQSLVTRVAI